MLINLLPASGFASLLVSLVYLQVKHDHCVVDKPTYENNYTLSVVDLKKCKVFETTYSLSLGFDPKYVVKER